MPRLPRTATQTPRLPGCAAAIICGYLARSWPDSAPGGQARRNAAKDQDKLAGVEPAPIPADQPDGLDSALTRTGDRAEHVWRAAAAADVDQRVAGRGPGPD